MMYYICHHVPPKLPPVLALLYCIIKSKTHESCCLSIVPFCNTATCAKLELIIHTKKNKNHRVTGLLPDPIVTFLNLKSNILSSALCEAELRLCVAQSGVLGSSFTSAIDPRQALSPLWNITPSFLNGRGIECKIP